MALLTQEDVIGGTGVAWHAEVAEDLAERLTPPSGFPCTFSQNAFSRALVRFIFVERLDAEGRAALLRDLSEYIARARDWDGKLSTAEPLVVAFSTEAVSEETVEGYHARGWEILQFLHDNDPAPWPEGVATEPGGPYWSMCFDGMQIFVNMSSPAHEKRQSRNLGRHFLFIVNPRERFDIVAGDTPEGRKVRQRIRARIEAYDGLGHCPQLGSYEAGEIEWWQYGITEENRIRTDTCPLKQRKNA